VLVDVLPLASVTDHAFYVVVVSTKHGKQPVSTMPTRLNHRQSLMGLNNLQNNIANSAASMTIQTMQSSTR